MRRFTVKDKDLFLDRPIISSTRSLDADTSDYDTIFTGAERLRIIYHYLHTIRIGDLDLIQYLIKEV